LLDRRIDAAIAGKYDLYFGSEWRDKDRDTIDKRQTISYLLFVVAQLKKPDGTPLYPEALDRVEAVIGLLEYARAAQHLALALANVQERVLKAIVTDRDGADYEDKGAVAHQGGFINAYRAEIRRLQGLVTTIKDRQSRLDDLLAQVKGYEAIVKERKEAIDDVTKKLVAARAQTAAQMKELNALQKQFFDAKIRLRNAHEQNLRLEQTIRRVEGLKGTP
jgi:hypothetical protein